MSGSISQKLESALGSKILQSRPLRGGDIADVSLLTLADTRQVVAKRPRMDQPDTTAIEKMMLRHLKSKSALPVPDVLFQTAGLLVLSYVQHEGIGDAASASVDVARHVAALHTVQPKGNRPYYGLDKDTFIGPLPQLNNPAADWCSFFRDNRLLAMAGSAVRTGKLPADIMARIDIFAKKIGDFLPTTPKSSLLHGDLWAGNILIDGNRVAGFIDPAISYGHAEMDLAFIDLMGGLDPKFFEGYNEISAIDAGFEAKRKIIYQLWPLLVHVRLFGGGYVDQVSQRLEKLGF